MAAPLTEIRLDNTSQEEAKRIYQGVLDQMADALERGDINVLVGMMNFPFTLNTTKATFIIENPDELHRGARYVAQALSSMGTDYLILLASQASFLSENYIQGQHMTHTLCGASGLVPAYLNRMTLSRMGGRWLITCVDSMIDNATWPITVPKVTVGAQPQWDEVAPELDGRRSSTTPLNIYQDFLDACSAANMAQDEAAWHRLCHYPHTVHMNEVDAVIETPDDIRAFLDMIHGHINQYGIDRIDRAAEHAEFLSGTQICGYHTTTLSAKGELKIGPVSSRYIITRTGTQWRMTSVTNSVSNESFPYTMPEISDVLVSMREIQQRTRRQ